MTIEKIVGDIVLLVLDNHEPLKALGITQSGIYAKIAGYDENGIWIDHPHFKIAKTTPSKDRGETKPDSQDVAATILISRAFIVSVVHFPGVEGFDFPSPFESHIGFNIDA